jgi:putative effector of murein hydrolase
LDIPYDSYNAGGSMINMMLGPATACMAMSIYRKWELLKKQFLPILAGCFVGAATGVISVFLLCRLFGLDDTLTVTLLPKAVTTPIATAITEPYGGVISITAVAVIFTGILGNLSAPFLIRLFRVEDDPLAAGLAIGACSHGIGTARALELGETEGAMSGLAIGICEGISYILLLKIGILLFNLVNMSYVISYRQLKISRLLHINERISENSSVLREAVIYCMGSHIAVIFICNDKIIGYIYILKSLIVGLTNS